LLLAVLVVGIGTIYTAVEVGIGVANDEVRYEGKLDAHEILRYYQGDGADDDPLPRIKRGGYQYLSSAHGVMTEPQASPGEVAAWAVGELAPWLLAIATLVPLWPIVRRAERGDPFWDGAARRLAIVGQLLLIGIPLVVVYQDLIASAFTGGLGVSPMVSTSIKLSVWHFLPGVAMLVLAGVFRRGAELRDFEAHAV
jgi:Protein of unknown function (DUF2975)